MLDTRLILIDGIPGSGKSTAGENVARRLEEMDIAHRFYHELEEGHPLRCYDSWIESLRSPEEADAFVEKVDGLFAAFAEDRLQVDEIAIVESWLFQDTIGFALNVGMPRERILALMETIKGHIEKLSPSLIYFYQEDVEQSWRFICGVRGEKWARRIFGGEPDFGEAARLWQSHQDFVHGIVRAWDIPQLVIRNSDYQWDVYTRQIAEFLQLQ